MEGTQARLGRSESGWRLNPADADEEFDSAGVLKLVGTGQFFPRSVEIVPDLAELLFMEAVKQAEASVGHLQQAAPHIAELAGEGIERKPIAWVLGTTELDRAVRAAIASIILAIAAGEAQVDYWADARGGWQDDEDRSGVAEKCVTLAQRFGAAVHLGGPPYQGLHVAAKRRNSLVHSKPIPQIVPAIGAGAPLPGRTISIEARTTCLAVRRSFVDVARHLAIDRPRFLAYCPDVDPTDDQTWWGATVLTGIRSDADPRR